jgi:hypothetical protein
VKGGKMVPGGPRGSGAGEGVVTCGLNLREMGASGPPDFGRRAQPFCICRWFSLRERVERIIIFVKA